MLHKWTSEKVYYFFCNGNRPDTRTAVLIGGSNQACRRSEGIPTAPPLTLKYRTGTALRLVKAHEEMCGTMKTIAQTIAEDSMVRIECDPEGGFSVVEGYEEFLELMEKKGMVEVSDTSTGRRYFAHEVGNEIYLLNQASQEALTTMADILVQNIVKKSLY